MAIYVRAFHHIASELDVMHEYVLTVRGALKNVHEKLHKDVKARTDRLSEEESQAVFNDHADDDILLGDLFPALSSSWTFVSIVSFLEHQLVFICREVLEAKTGERAFAPQRGVLDECKRCLKGQEIAVPVDGPEWQEVRNLQHVRDVIVHRLGELKEENEEDGRGKEVYRYVSNRTDVSIQHCKIVPTHVFCLHAIEVVRTFLSQLVALIPTALYRKPSRER